jgi:hypothetical protein
MVARLEVDRQRLAGHLRRRDVLLPRRWSSGTSAIPRTIVASLSDERYKKLIIEVDDPDAVVERLRFAIRSRPTKPTPVLNDGFGLRAAT